MGNRETDDSEHGAAVDAGNDVDVGQLDVAPGSRLAELLADRGRRRFGSPDSGSGARLANEATAPV